MKKIVFLIATWIITTPILAATKHGSICTDESPGHIHPADAPPHANAIKVVTNRPSVPPVSQMPSTKFKANPMSIESKNPTGNKPINTEIESPSLEGSK